MDPIVTPAGIDLSPATVVGAVFVGVLVGLIGVAARGGLMALLDELAADVRAIGARLIATVLRRRPNLPQTPWFCVACRSSNVPSASVCYSCGAERAVAEAPVPAAEPPAGPSAGTTMRRG